MINCPEHPDEGMLAIICEQYTAPVDLYTGEQGVEIEFGPEADFMRSMSTSVIIGYKCRKPECGFKIDPERLR